MVKQGAGYKSVGSSSRSQDVVTWVLLFRIGEFQVHTYFSNILLRVFLPSCKIGSSPLGIFDLGYNCELMFSLFPKRRVGPLGWLLVYGSEGKLLEDMVDAHRLQNSFVSDTDAHSEGYPTLPVIAVCSNFSDSWDPSKKSRTTVGVIHLVMIPR